MDANQTETTSDELQRELLDALKAVRSVLEEHYVRGAATTFVVCESLMGLFIRKIDPLIAKAEGR